MQRAVDLLGTALHCLLFYANITLSKSKLKDNWAVHKEIESSRTATRKLFGCLPFSFEIFIQTSNVGDTMPLTILTFVHVDIYNGRHETRKEAHECMHVIRASSPLPASYSVVDHDGEKDHARKKTWIWIIEGMIYYFVNNEWSNQKIYYVCSNRPFHFLHFCLNLHTSRPFFEPL